MIVFVAGMPRAGSMWTYNIVRELFEHKKYTVLPKQTPLDESDLITEALKSSVVDDEVYCIKTHLQLNNPLTTQHDIKIISNIRDVRDACLSYMRFMHGGFDAGIRAMIGMMRTTDHYMDTFTDNLLTIRFEDINEAAIDTINRVCNYLELPVSEEKKCDIVNKFSKSTIIKHLDKLSDVKIESNGTVKDAEHRESYDVVGNLDGTYRVFDKRTSFQSNHITSKKDGEWKEVFNEDQITRLTDVSREWILKHEYEL